MSIGQHFASCSLLTSWHQQCSNADSADSGCKEQVARRERTRRGLEKCKKWVHAGLLEQEAQTGESRHLFGELSSSAATPVTRNLSVARLPNILHYPVSRITLSFYRMKEKVAKDNRWFMGDSKMGI